MLRPLSFRYDNTVKVTEQLDDLPPNAKSFVNMRDVLAKQGVEWTSYARVQSRKLAGKGMSGAYVVSGLQATGNYKGQPVIIETKVGVRKNAAGYLYQFGEMEPATCVKSEQVIQRIQNKIRGAGSRNEAKEDDVLQREAEDALESRMGERNREETRPDGLIEIHNPTADRIKRGMMIRVHAPGEPFDTTGEMVLDVDVPGDRVLVWGSIGGTEEWKRWYPVDQVKVVWDIGGYEKAMHLIDQMDAELKAHLKKNQGGVGDAIGRLKKELHQEEE